MRPRRYSPTWFGSWKRGSAAVLECFLVFWQMWVCLFNAWKKVRKLTTIDNPLIVEIQPELWVSRTPNPIWEPWTELPLGQNWKHTSSQARLIKASLLRGIWQPPWVFIPSEHPWSWMLQLCFHLPSYGVGHHYFWCITWEGLVESFVSQARTKAQERLAEPRWKFSREKPHTNGLCAKQWQ